MYVKNRLSSSRGVVLHSERAEKLQCVVVVLGGDRVEKLQSAIVVLGEDRVGKKLRNFVQGQVDRKETSLETLRFIVSSCQW